MILVVKFNMALSHSHCICWDLQTI